MIHRILRPPRPRFRPSAIGARAVLSLSVLGIWATSCTPVGVTTTEPEPVSTPIPSIQEGRLSAAEQEEAGLLLSEARDFLASEAFEAAREAAADVIQRFPGATGSAEALEILASAALELGEIEASIEASTRYLGILDSSHPSYPGVLLLYTRALMRAGEPVMALDALVELPTTLPPELSEPTSEILRELMAQVATADLVALAGTLGPGHPIRGALATELALSFSLGQETEEAREWAELALEEELSQRDREISMAVLAGNLEEVLGQPLVLGAILPQTGVSPGLLEYGLSVLEGIQVAIEEYQGDLRRPIRLEVMDHGGDLDEARTGVRRLENLGARGIIGPLSLDFLNQAAEARQTGLPLVSPFASLPSTSPSGVFSLSGADPGGAEVVARYAWDLGLERVVVLRPRTDEALIDSEAFQEVFQGLGGIVRQEIVFDSGATFFQTEFDQVGDLLPDGLFLPLKARDVQLLAPQFTYFGLDTLGIQLLGTTGWTEDEVVLDVDSRHTDGVIASTTRMSQDETEAYRLFRLRYEELFQKTLRDPVAAYGYDAAVLLLEGLLRNPDDAQDMLMAMDDIEDFPGATGHLTVEGGRVRRVPQLVRIQDHELIFITPHFH